MARRGRRVFRSRGGIGPMSAKETLSLLQRVDEACLRFEDRWRSGQRPRLEAQLAEFDPGDEAEVLGELLLLEWSYRVRGGESFYFDEYAQRFASRRAAVERAWERWKEKQSFSTALPANTPAGPTMPPMAF